MIKISFTVVSLFFSTFAFSASKDQITAALGASSLTDITSVTETPDQPSCVGCRDLRVEGKLPFGEVYQIIEVIQTGTKSFSAKIIEFG